MMAEDEWAGWNPLHLAAHDGNLAAVDQFIRGGADMNAFDEIGFTPLHYAVEAGHLEVATYLIEHGADVNAHDESKIGNTPLGEAAGECSLEMARLLVEAGADPTIRGWMQLNALDRAERRTRGDGPDVRSLLADAARRRGKMTP
jgi:ankyrin repeat protein